MCVLRHLGNPGEVVVAVKDQITRIKPLPTTRIDDYGCTCVGFGLLKQMPKIKYVLVADGIQFGK